MTTVATAVLPGPPTTLTHLHDLTVATRCFPAGPHGEPAGGDFVDACRIGRSRVLLAVGDVAGHGPPAARRMAQLRAATQVHARLVASPVELLRRLEQLATAWETEDIATVWLGMYDPGSGLLQHANAGHPPPVLWVDGTTSLLPVAGSPPLGSGYVTGPRPAQELHLPVGALLVGYSDGLVERPGRDLEDQLHLLRHAVGRGYTATPAVSSPTGSSAGTSPADEPLHLLVLALLSQMLPDPATARDDACILAVRRDAAVRSA